MVSVAGEDLQVRLGVSHRFTLVSVELARRRFQEGASSLKAEAVAGGDYFYESSSLCPLLEVVACRRS
jgi:hypothetical protein